MIKFLGGFFSCLCLVILIAASQIRTDYKDEFSIYDEFTNVYDTLQQRQFTVVTDTPAVAALQDIEVVFIDADTKVLTVRFGEEVWGIEFTTRMR